MTDHRPAPPLPRPAPATEPGPLDDQFYDLVEARFVRLVRDNPVLATAIGLHQDDDLLGDGSREAVLAELAADQAHLGSDRGARPGRAVAGGRVRARPRAPQRPARHLRRRGPAHLGAPVVRARHARRRPVPAVRPRLRAAPRAARCDRRPARGDGHLPRGGQDPRDGPAGPALAADRDRDRRRAAGLLRRDRRRRRGSLAGGRAASPGAGERVGQGRGRAVHGLARGHAAGRDGRMGDRPRAPRRAGRLARLRRARCRRDPRARLGAAARGACAPGRGRARDRSRRSTRRASSSGSRATSRGRSRRPSTPIATRCSGRAPT